MAIAGAREISEDAPSPIIYSICTLVTERAEYTKMVQSFVEKGFSLEDCEYLFIDNSMSNRFDAFAGYNRFLQQSRGRYVILCHQDTKLLHDGRGQLDSLLAEMDTKHLNWGLCGNAGCTPEGKEAVRITDPWGGNRSIGGPFPVLVMSLDENFIVVRREANLGLSRDLDGFHWYGADICINAGIRGWRSYVIDFHLIHKSGGNKNEDFFAIRSRLIEKLSFAFRPRWFFTPTHSEFYVSHSRVAVLYHVMQHRAAQVIRRLYDHIVKRIRVVFR